MKRLILMRHAKSDWTQGSGSDHDRPLNQPGRKAAALLGAWLAREGHMPDEVLCSSAERTQETCARLNLSADPTRHNDPALYLANADAMLKALMGAQGDRVLMIGHNPGIAMMARSLIAEPPEHAHFAQYPTGATLIVDFDVDNWNVATWGQGITRQFVVPREL